MAVDLPSVNNSVPTVHAPQSRVSPGQIASPYLELADTLNQAAKETGDLAKLAAHDEGLRSVTRDENGNIQVQRPVIVGDAALAYKQGMQTAAVADQEDVVKTELLKLRHEFKDDPAGYAAAAEPYIKQKQAQLTKAAGPEVGITVGKVAANISREHHEGLLNQKESRDLQRATASIETQVESTKDELFAIIAGGADERGPEVQQRIQKIGALWGQLSNNPRLAIPKERVDFEIKKLQSEMYVAGADRRAAEIQSRDGPQAAEASAKQILTDPGLALSPADRATAYSRVVGGITQRSNAQAQQDKQVGVAIQNVGKTAEQGYAVPPAEIAAVRSMVVHSGNPGLVAALHDVEVTQPIIADWRKGSPIELEHFLANNDQVMREHGATPTLLTLQKTGTELLKNMRAGLKADPLDWAGRTGAAPIQPVDLSQPATMQARVAAAETVAQHYGVAPHYLTPDEKGAIQAATAAGGKAMTDVAAAINAGFGDRAPKVLAEISKDSPVLAHIGGLMNTQGSQAVISDAAEATRLRQDPEAKKNLPHWFTQPTDKIFAAQMTETVNSYGGAFALAPDTGRAAEATAKAAFDARALRHNYDPALGTGSVLDTTGSKTAYQKALQEAAGATYAPDGTVYGGVSAYKTGVFGFRTPHNVLVPGNIKQDRFTDVIGAIRDEDVGGKWQVQGRTYGVNDVQRATPVAVRGGYRFAVGDPQSDDPKWIPDANGRPLTIDVGALEPALRKRVPDAFAP